MESLTRDSLGRAGFGATTIHPVLDTKIDIHFSPRLGFIIQQCAGQRVAFEPRLWDKQRAAFPVHGECHVREIDMRAAAVKNSGDTQGDRAGKVDGLAEEVPGFDK